MGRLVEMLWDCPYCDTKGILGRHQDCPNCGKGRGEETEFYMDGKIRYVTDESIKARVSKNPDWYCSVCDTFNSDNDDRCCNCGAPKSMSKKNYFEIREEEVNELEEETPLKELVEYTEEDISSKTFKFNISQIDILTIFNNLGKIFKYILPIVGLICFISLIIFLLLPKDKILTITEMSWNREIEIQEEITVDESGWFLPVGARLHYTKLEFHHNEKVIDHYETVTEQKSRQVIDHYKTVTEQKSRQVIDGYEEVVTGYRDLGNGFAEEITTTRPIYKTEYYTETHQEPVYKTEYYTETHEEPVYRNEPIYQTKYYYEIDKWVYKRSINTSGTDKSPYFGEVKLGFNERESTRHENYNIVAIDEDGINNNYSLNFIEWDSLNVNETIKAKVNLLGLIYSFEKMNGDTLNVAAN